MAFTRILEEVLVQAVFDGLFDKDETDNDESNEILGATTIPQADLMAANLGEDEGEDEAEREDQFDRADLMASALGIGGSDQEDEGLSSTPLVTTTTDSSSANADIY